MEHQFTIEEVRESMTKRGLKYDIDDFYTSIAQEYSFTNVISDFYGKKLKLPYKDYGRLESLVLKSLDFWESDYLDVYNSRFRHIWSRDGQRFVVPAFITKVDFEDYDIQLKIIAANIGYAANNMFSNERNLEEYQVYAKKYPGNLDRPVDKMVAMSLNIVYRSIADNHSTFKEMLDLYVQNESSKKWLDLYVIPLFRKIEINLMSSFDKALNSWANSNASLYKYYPIAVHYGNRCNAFKVAEFLIRKEVKENEVTFQKAIASVVSTKPHIKAEIKELKRRHFSPYSEFDESCLYRTQREKANDALSIDEEFEKILEWSRRKAAADFIFYLEDQLEIGDSLRDTDLTLAEFSNLAFFLAEIDLFDKPESAVLHLSRFFKGVNSKGKTISLKYGTLKMMKDIAIIDELKKVFSKINK